MIVVSERQYQALAAEAQAREIVRVAAALWGEPAACRAAAAAACDTGHAHGLGRFEDLVTLGEIFQAYGTDAAAADGVPWVHELVTGTAPDRGRRLAECRALARGAGR